MKKLTLYQLYKKTIESFLKEDNLTEFVEFYNELNVLIEYMLDGRFIPEKKKKLKKKEFIAKSADLIKYLQKDNEIINNVNIDHKLDLLDMIKFFKLLENFMLRREYMHDLKELKLGKYYKNAKAIFDNFPKLSLSIEKLDLVSKEYYLNLIFSIICIYRQFKVKSSPNKATIIEGYTGAPIESIIANEFSEASIKEWCLSTIPNDKFNISLSIYSGNASSPNSKASSSKLMEDISAVFNEPVLWNSILNMNTHFKGGDQLSELMNLLALTISNREFNGGENILENKNNIHSRLFHFTASGGKARIIANVDWITQSALSGIHYCMFDLLSKIKSDFTFNHKSGIPHLYNNKNTEKDNYYSVDLSAATDRMPRLLQAEIIKGIFNHFQMNGDEISKLWLNIVDRTYSTKNSTINDNQNIRYSVGQGMGIFSSWTSMALMHHFIVNKVCKIPTDNYSLVGDDLLIKGKREYYDNYIQFMSKIGMTVNKNKTIISEDGRNCIEFARNYIISSIKIQPINFGTLFAVKDNKASIESFIYSMNDNINIDIVYNLIENLNIKVNNLKIACLYLYFKKRNIQMTFKNKFENELIIKDIDYDKIIEITTKEKPYVNTFKKINKDFYSTLSSQLVVRTKDEVLEIFKLSKEILDLEFEFEQVGVANIIWNRLNNVQIIQYDLNDLGNPLITKRERSLLVEVLKNYKLKVN